MRLCTAALLAFVEDAVNGKRLTGTIDADTAFACWSGASDPSGGEDAGCDDSLLEPGVIVREAAGEDDGDGFFFTSIDLIDE